MKSTVRADGDGLSARTAYMKGCNMLRKMLSVMFVFASAYVVSGCAEDEHTVSQETQSQTESEPRDVDQGTMIVE
ncbi:MAG: hypothetical protein HS101_08765 [Planctomycetia bacterium]|nr:hypothetical protein [Planctomycetia bacterium]MCC7315942.1 hypothetical protein [Planctomycetota bacterium]OQZ03457.1 MAG: hypothetical protein B6D36_12895 [Planctomycetes bacterium UTPLA1]